MNKVAQKSQRSCRYISLALSFNVLIALTGGSFPAWADKVGETSSRLVTEAKDYLAKGQLREAEIQLKNALRENPADLDARITLGVVAMRKGDAAGAERTFKAVLKQNGARELVLPLLGQSYLMQGKTREILSELNPDGLAPKIAAQIVDLRARAYVLQKESGDAKREAEAALALQPEMPDALLTLALLNRQQGDNFAAELLVDRALKVAPNNVQALDAKGDLRATLGDPTNALAAFQKSLAERPDGVNAKLGEVAAFLALGQVDQARAGVDEFLKRVPGQPTGIYFRALILEREGRYAEALMAFEPAAVARLDDSFNAQLLLGELNLRADLMDKAESHTLRALSLAPTSLGAKLLLAMVYTRKDQPLKVVELLEPIAAGSPNNARLEMIMGNAYGRLGRFSEASKALEIAVQQNPSDPDLRTRLAASRIAAGDQEAGISDLSSLLQADPQAKRVGVLLVSSMINQGRFAEATKTALDLRETQPGDPLIDSLLGRINWMAGNWTAAEANFKSALHKQPSFLEAAKNLVLLKQLRGAPDEADVLFANVLKADAKNFQAMIALSEIAQGKGNDEAAIAWIEKAVATAPAPAAVEIRVQLVELLLAQKKTQKALATAQVFERNAHDVPQIVNVLARAQLAAGQRDSAIISLRHLAELQPNVGLGKFQLGQTLASLGRPDDAIVAYREAVERDPGYLPAWQALVAAIARTAGLDQSMEAIRQAMTNSAVAPYGDVLKGEAYLAAKRYPEADGAFRAALNRAPNVRLVMRLAETRSEAGDRKGMISTLSDWLKAHPDDFGARSVYADALMANKDAAAAEREYQTLLAVNPVSVAVLNNLSWLRSTTDPVRAVEYGHRAFGLEPHSPQVRDTLAWALLQKGDTSTATTLLRMAHAQLPDDLEISYHLAMALARGGDDDGARTLVKPLAEGKVSFSSHDDAKQLLRKLGAKKSK